MRKERAVQPQSATGDAGGHKVATQTDRTPVVGTSTVDAKTIKRCALSVRLPGVHKTKSQALDGRLVTVQPPQDGAFGEASMVRLEIESAAGEVVRLLVSAPSADLLPVRVGDSVTGAVECSRQGPELLCDARLERDGELVLAISGTGETSVVPQWQVETTDIVERRQSPNLKQKSIRRSHAVTFARGSWSTRVEPGRCHAVEHGGSTWLLAGHGVSWEGARPPGGVDYKMFTMIRQR